MSGETDAQAVIDTATAAATPRILTPDDIYHVVVPAGASSTVVDLERFLPAPRRATGTVRLTEASSLVAYVQAQRVPEPTPALYADLENSTVTAILNGHEQSVPGWGDHRAVLSMKKTPEWLLWEGKDRRWLAQAAFAEHIEEGQADIVEPPAADMLELAQTLSANTKVAFRSQTLLGNGQRQLTYEETLEAKAGQRGQITMPPVFTLGVVPFEGMVEGYKVVARLQYRISGQELSIRYLLERPWDVLKSAFADIVGQVEQGTTLLAYAGRPAT